MTRKEQNKILNDKIESNINQYKVDRLNAEISAFSSGDLNKYEFLTRKDQTLGQTFSTGLDKTAQGYQEEGVVKLLKDIRDGLRGGVRPPGPDDDNNDDDNNDDDNHDDDNHDDDNHDDDNNDDDNNDGRVVIKHLLNEINNINKQYNDAINNINKKK